MIEKYLEWSEFKALCELHELGMQLFQETEFSYEVYTSYDLFLINCKILKDSGADQTDFETNFKASANKSLKHSVQTRFERDDIVLKICSLSTATVTDTDKLVASILVPGVLANGEHRVVDGGKAWFEPRHKDNKILKVEIVDEDNVLGYGAGTVVKSYTDSEVPDANSGWYIPPVGHVEVETLGDYGVLPSELYVRITGKLAAGAEAGTKMYINIDWAKVE